MLPSALPIGSPLPPGGRAERLRRLIADEAGATAIEYAVVLSIIVLFLVGALTLFGTGLAGTFNRLSTTLK